MKQLLTLDWSPQAQRALQNLADLSKDVSIIDIGIRLESCRNTIFGEGIKIAVREGNVQDAIKMITDQVALGNEDEVEWCIGRTTLEKIKTLKSWDK